MKATTLSKTVGSGLLLLGLTLATAPSAQAQGRVVQRSLQEWLAAQGRLPSPRAGLPNTPRLFGFVNNPDINGDGVDDGPRYFLWFDYAGVLSRPTSTGGGALGPESITGTVRERPIGNGMAEYTVALDVKGAILWVARNAGCVVGTTCPVVFGARETDVANGAPPALADARLTIRFNYFAGAPLPDLRTPGLDWFSDTLVLHGVGSLTANYDPSVAAGTLGFLRWGKPYITPPANENADNGAYSQFPNDEFHLFPVGPR